MVITGKPVEKLGRKVWSLKHVNVMTVLLQLIYCSSFFFYYREIPTLYKEEGLL